MLKITYSDTRTGRETSYTLSEEEVKALETDVADVVEWHLNAIRQKARQQMDRVCEEALADATGAILKPKHRQQIAAALAERGILAPTVKHLPEDVRRQIVSLAADPTAHARP